MLCNLTILKVERSQTPITTVLSSPGLGNRDFGTTKDGSNRRYKGQGSAKSRPGQPGLWHNLRDTTARINGSVLSNPGLGNRDIGTTREPRIFVSQTSAVLRKFFIYFVTPELFGQHRVLTISLHPSCSGSTMCFFFTEWAKNRLVCKWFCRSFWVFRLL